MSGNMPFGTLNIYFWSFLKTTWTTFSLYDFSVPAPNLFCFQPMAQVNGVSLPRFVVPRHVYTVNVTIGVFGDYFSQEYIIDNSIGSEVG